MKGRRPPQQDGGHDGNQDGDQDGDHGGDHGGNDRQRALLVRAPVPVPSQHLRREVWRALEERLSPHGRRRAARRLALALAGTVLVGSTLAYAVVRVRTEVVARRPAPGPAINARPLSPAPASAAPPPAPAPPRERAPAHEPLPTRRRVAVRLPPPASPPSFPLGAPGLEGPWPLRASPPALGEEPGSESEDDLLSPTPPPRLVIAREGRRDVSLVLAGDRIVGTVRGHAVALTITEAQILGRLGEVNLSLWLHGHEAEGHIGSAPVRFQLLDTRDGHLLREGYFPSGLLPPHTTRIATTATSLAWYPGCDAALARIEPGKYQGRCARGKRAGVTIPEAWQRLPVLTRLILLSFFLTERDPRLEDLFQ